MMDLHRGRRVRLGLTLKLLIVADASILIVYFFFLLYALPMTSDSTMQERITRVEMQARMARDILQYNYGLQAAGDLTDSEAQARALDEVSSLGSSSGGVDDVWVLDDVPVLLAGASLSSRINTSVGDVEDSEGKAVFAEMVRISAGQGEGTYRYSWQPGGGSGSVDTIASVTSFDPWGWTVSVSSPVGSIGSRTSGVNSTLGWMGGALAVASIVLFWVVVRAAVIKPLFSLKRTSEALALGDVDQKIEVRTGDEVGDMAGAYSEVIDYMKEMAEVARRVAEGDLTVPIRPRSEKDVLSHALSRMVGRQRDLIGGVKSAATSVAEASENLSRASEQSARVAQQIASTIQQVAKGTSEQSACLQEVVTSEQTLSRSIEQMAGGSQEQAASAEEAARMVKQVSVSATQVWQNAQSGNEAWKSTAKSAEAGARTTYETVEGMKRIKDAIDRVSLRVADLGQRSNEIGSIVATIDDIAAQTNLLALNAAIEAARAGDQGRGFAVVADEVRKLAERSSSATKEIASLIGSIQSGVAEAVKAMERGSREVESGYDLAGEAGKALDDILESSQAVGKQVHQISTAAEELNALSGNMVNVIQQISRTIDENAAATEAMAESSSNVSASIENVGSVAEENSASAEQVSASVEEMSAGVEEVLASAQTLADMAAGLKASVSAFKTGD